MKKKSLSPAPPQTGMLIAQTPEGWRCGVYDFRTLDLQGEPAWIAALETLPIIDTLPDVQPYFPLLLVAEKKRNGEWSILRLDDAPPMTDGMVAPFSPSPERMGIDVWIAAINKVKIAPGYQESAWISGLASALRANYVWAELDVASWEGLQRTLSSYADALKTEDRSRFQDILGALKEWSTPGQSKKARGPAKTNSR